MKNLYNLEELIFTLYTTLKIIFFFSFFLARNSRIKSFFEFVNATVATGK